MNDLRWSGRVVAALRIAFAVSLVVLLAAPSFAGTILATGFESPDYVAGSDLYGQQNWREYARDSSATVESGVGVSGSQGVEVKRAPYDDAYWWVPGGSYPSSLATPLIDISWDMKVMEASTSGSLYGPFFGVVAQQDSGTLINWFGALGVDGATGDVLRTTFGGALVPIAGESVSFGSWHNFKIRLDFTTSTYSLFKDNVSLGAPLAWVDAGGLFSLTDADIMATAADANGLAAAGTAYFDNFSVSEVPEPSTLALCLAGLVPMGLYVARRRRR